MRDGETTAPSSRQREPVVLYKHNPAWGIPSLSPDSLVVEAYLCLAECPYAVQPCETTSDSPADILPVVEVGDDLYCPPNTATHNADPARFIVEQLKESFEDLDSKLSLQQKALVPAFDALFYSSVLPGTLHFTWADFGRWRQHIRPVLGNGLPFPASYVVPWSQRRAVLACQSHLAFGTRDEVLKRACAAYDSFDAMLSSSRGPYIFGDKPSSIDAFIFAHLLYQRNAPVCLPLREELLKRKNLADYLERTHHRIFSSPAPAPPQDAGARQRARAEQAEEPRERTEKEERFERRGQAWLGMAAAAVVGYVLLSGAYIDVDTGAYLQDEDEDEAL